MTAVERLDFQPENFRTPENTNQAYSFGRMSGYRREPIMTRHEFFGSNGEQLHPFPDSLWRAYLKGHRVGSQKRQERGEAPDA